MMPLRGWMLVGLIVLGGAGCASWWYFQSHPSGPGPRTPVSPDEQVPTSVLYERWLKGLEPVGAEAATADLAGLVLCSEGQRLCKDFPEVARLECDRAQPEDLCRLEAVRRLLTQPHPGPGALLSDAYQPVMQELAAGGPERIVKARTALNGLGRAWNQLRDDAATAPVVGDRSLVWLELVQGVRSGRLSEVRLPAKPVLPLFGDHEGVLVQNLETWLNSPPAQRAFAPDQYLRLYRDGRIPALPRELIGSRERWSEDIKQESRRATEDRAGPEPAQLRDGYLALLRFLNRFADRLGQL